LPIVIGAALGTAAFVGIAIAIVACLALSGTATYAVVNNMGDGAIGEVQNNPLFKPSGNSQMNPLFKDG